MLQVSTKQTLIDIKDAAVPTEKGERARLKCTNVSVILKAGVWGVSGSETRSSVAANGTETSSNDNADKALLGARPLFRRWLELNRN